MAAAPMHPLHASYGHLPSISHHRSAPESLTAGGGVQCLREVMGLTDKYLAKLVEASFATYHFLRLGILLWMASQESKLWFSSSAVAILIGANQAPRGKWSQEWADEGLWPNHEDVVEEFEAFEGEIIAELCAPCHSFLPHSHPLPGLDHCPVVP